MARINLFDTKQLAEEIQRRNKRLKPRHDRMDYWLGMYLLYDAYQDHKPLGQRKFVSNDPQSIVDTTHRIISRFPWLWMLAVDKYEETPEEMARLYGQVERSLYGFIGDIDDDLVNRGEMISRKWAGWQGLVRGKIASKVHLTTEAGRESNIVYAQYDSRFVLEEWGDGGLDSVICLTPMDIGELGSQYENVSSKYQPDEQCTKIEVWDKTKAGVAYSVGRNMSGIENDWLIPPTEHGLYGEDGKVTKGKLNRLPFVIRDVNGVGIRQKPTGGYTVGLNQVPRDLSYARSMLQGGMGWRNTTRSVSERGRSILAGIERHAPQFNEAVASIWQHFSIDMFGTYVMQTRGGTVPEGTEEALGSGGIIPLERGDTMQKFQPTAVNESAMKFLEIISSEKEKATISAILQSFGNFQSGFHQARAEQVAMNNIEPWFWAQSDVGSAIGQLIVDQIQMGGLTNKVSLSYRESGGGGDYGFYSIDFDPKMLKEIGHRILVEAQVEPALPYDMLERANIANLLTNGRRPLVSRRYAQESILKIPDASREGDRIWNDIAELDQVAVQLELAEAADRLGRPELARLYRDRHAMAMIMEVAQRIALQSQLGGGGGGGAGLGLGYQGGGQGDGQPNSPPPEVEPPEERGQGREQVQQ